MPKRSSKKKKADTQQLARRVLDAVTPETEASAKKPARGKKNPAAVALGRLGGLKGGRARAESLSDKERSDIARAAATARWTKRSGGQQ